MPLGKSAWPYFGIEIPWNISSIFCLLKLHDSCKLWYFGFPFLSKKLFASVCASIVYWQPDRIVEQFNGLWAICWINEKRMKSHIIVRCVIRNSIKPLVYRVRETEITSAIYHASKLQKNLKGLFMSFQCSYRTWKSNGEPTFVCRLHVVKT